MKSLSYIDVFTPKNLEEALELLDKHRGELAVLAGGTDLIIQLRKSQQKAPNLLNIYMLDELRYIKQDNGTIKIGALTDFATITESPIIQRHAPVLAEAAATIGSVQILNKASIGGNIVNASPAADSLPALYVLNATLSLRSKTGTRKVAIEQFYKGYKKLDLQSGELLTEVSFPAMKQNQIGMFFKHGLRQGDAISVVNGAILLEVLNGYVKDARIALGAVAPTVVRATESEKTLIGQRLSEDVILKAAQACLTSISPIDDVRGSASYRKEMCVNYLYMALWQMMRMVNV